MFRSSGCLHTDLYTPKCRPECDDERFSLTQAHADEYSCGVTNDGISGMSGTRRR